MTNWGDKFDVDSFWITTQRTYDQFLKLVIDYDLTALDEFYFGTNETIAFDPTDQFLQSLKVTLITKEFYDQLKNN